MQQKKKMQRLSARVKLRNYFADHVGEVLDSNTLREIGGISEWARRVRELRDEEGLDIVTHNDLDSLKPNEYMLRSLEIKPSAERSISKEVRALVLDRDGYTCQMCGAVAGEPHPYNRNQKTRLHIGHIVDKSLGGTDDIENLQALCSVCNEGAANITFARPDVTRLLAQVRRAPRLDQQEVLYWLITKFPAQAKRKIEEGEG